MPLTAIGPRLRYRVAVSGVAMPPGEGIRGIFTTWIVTIPAAREQFPAIDCSAGAPAGPGPGSGFLGRGLAGRRRGRGRPRHPGATPTGGLLGPVDEVTDLVDQLLIRTQVAVPQGILRLLILRRRLVQQVLDVHARRGRRWGRRHAFAGAGLH